MTILAATTSTKSITTTITIAPISAMTTVITKPDKRTTKITRTASHTHDTTPMTTKFAKQTITTTATTTTVTYIPKTTTVTTLTTDTPVMTEGTSESTIIVKDIMKTGAVNDFVQQYIK